MASTFTHWVICTHSTLVSHSVLTVNFQAGNCGEGDGLDSDITSFRKTYPKIIRKVSCNFKHKGIAMKRKNVNGRR